MLYDKVGNLTNLLDEAKKIVVEKGPEKLSNHNKKMNQIALTHDIKTIEGLIEVDNYEGATLLITELLLIAIDCLYDYYGWFKVTSKRIIADLKNHDENLGEDASLVILSNDIKAKYVHFLRLCNHVLELLGGKVYEYEIDFKK